MITATLKNYRQSARKVRLVVDEVRGKKVSEALIKLSFTPNKAAEPVKKLIESAVANAQHNHNMSADNLFIKSIVVDEGFTMKRWIPKWRGIAHPIRKRTSHIKVVLDGSEVKEDTSNNQQDTKKVKEKVEKSDSAKATSDKEETKVEEKEKKEKTKVATKK